MRARAYLAKSAHALALLGALTAAGLTPAMGGAGEQFAANGTSECADVLFVGVRGSGQGAEEFDGLGRQVAAVRDGLAQSLDGTGMTMRTHALDYSAASFGDLLKPSNLFEPLYLDSISEGWASLSAYLDSQRACLDAGEKLVLAGYSQGALIVHLAIANGWEYADSLVGALLVADPFRDPGVRNIGSADPGTGLYDPAQALAGMGFSIPGADLRAIPAETASVTFGLCNAFDVVCDFGDHFEEHLASFGAEGAGVHSAYEDEQLYQLGAVPARAILWGDEVATDADSRGSGLPDLSVGSRARGR